MIVSLHTFLLREFLQEYFATGFNKLIRVSFLPLLKFANGNMLRLESLGNIYNTLYEMLLLRHCNFIKVNGYVTQLIPERQLIFRIFSLIEPSCEFPPELSNPSPWNPSYYQIKFIYNAITPR